MSESIDTEIHIAGHGTGGGAAVRTCAAPRQSLGDIIPQFDQLLDWVSPCNRIVVVCAALQAAVALVAAPGYRAHGLQIDWASAIPLFAVQTMLIILWFHFRQYPGRGREQIVPEVILVILLMIVMTNIASPAQYVAVALNRPLVDTWLARADALLGVNVAVLARWTAGHRALSMILSVCYFSLLPQFIAAPVLVALLYGNRGRLWEYAFHFHFCLVVTLSALALFPAACAFQYYGFTSTIDQTGFISHFQAVRSGTFHLLVASQLQGMISMPSFHVAGALIVTWAFRGYRRVIIPLAFLNCGLIAATVMSGAHYFIDIVASFLLFSLSVVVYHAFVGRLLHVELSPATLVDAAAVGRG